ncbi:MAG: DUF971 domain-containing protein [Ignavibacteria bacterium]|nr:DUF971 domain-containing protein [Ignavibacteria bacterium]MBI3765859.1 DUF971 domain-containing protein [Ignavibacteriales bacterium]
MTPRKIKKTSLTEVRIEWDDGHKGLHTLQTLRQYCPCASCKMEIEANERSVMLPILKPGQYELRSIDTVGNYAVQLTWVDGHRTGIYTFDYLRQLCECDECKRTTAE